MTWITRDTAKKFLRIDSTDEDDIVDVLIDAAQSQIESYTGLALTNRQATLLARSWARLKSLAIGPVCNIISISYLDVNGATQTLPTDQYRLITNGLRAGIVPAFNVTPPDLLDAPDSIQVLASIGYYDGQLPGALRQALLLALGDAFSFRENTVADRSVTPTELPGGIMSLITNYRVW